MVRSTVFEADVTNGTVTLAPVLTNSAINLPIGILLSAPIVGRIPILAANDATTNGGYVRMPDFYVERGTLGNPKPSISAVAFGKSLIQRVIPGVAVARMGTGNILQSIGAGLLQGGGANANQGREPTRMNQPGTNPPATNQAPINNLLNRLLK